ncbi:hypothetical protein ACM46_11175 [Chryseobacterium angstadtii]|uniref:Uncharacterized protein n=1 Tax=Chryseobacterium angstadtii TaxID=558151 RepID=A0A0J7IFI3_9FLAO|nr:hypothetical protein [Chryseobacterium angstadtii]KMQ64784.1 hypothetical protein ACM46_11175 [Chryseobacterium angstadtii]
MIHIQLDPSVVTVRDTFGISLSLAGVYIDKEEETLPEILRNGTINDNNPLEDLAKVLYPWYWKEQPQKLLLYFYKENNSDPLNPSYQQINTSFTFVVNAHNFTDAEKDIKKLISCYNEELNKCIVTGQTINKNKISAVNKAGDIHLEDAQDSIPEAYLIGAIAGKAQKLAPLNEALSLVFFAADNFDFDKADNKPITHFVAFPIDSDDWVLEDNLPPVWDENGFMQKKYLREINGESYAVNVHSAVTPIPKPDQTKHGIKLRDDKANFDGTLITLEVNDTEDWSEKWLEKLFYHINPLEEIAGFISRYNVEDITANGVKQNIKDMSRLFFRGVALELRNYIAFGEIWEEKEGKKVLVDTKFHQSIREALKTQLDYDQAKLKDIALKLVDYQPDWKRLSQYLIASFNEDEQIKGKITFFSKIIAKTISDGEFNSDNFLSQWKEEIGLIYEVIKINGRKEQWVLASITESAKNTDFRTTDSQGHSKDVKLYDMFTCQESWNILEALCTDIPVYGNYFVPAGELRLKAFKQKYLKFLSPQNIKLQGKEGSSEYFESHEFQWRLILNCFFHVADENLTLDTEELKLSVPQLRALIKRCFAVINLMIEEEKNFDNVMYSNIPPVRIRLNTAVEKLDIRMKHDPGTLKTLPDPDDDLFDEISGYVVIQNRSQKRNDDNFGEEWKYLNRCKINRVQFQKEAGKKKLKKTDQSFETSFLIPSFLPKFSTDEENKEDPDFSFRQRFVEVKNEKNSLVAGFQKTNNDFETGNQSINEGDVMLENIFDIETNSTTGQIIKHVPYAYFYGYHYKFKAYVVLNSGVLPPELRNGSLTSFKKKLETDITKNICDFHFLRRVPVSSPRISSCSDIIKEMELPVPALPEGLKLLTYELKPYQEIREEFYGIKDQTDKASQQELSVTLLHNHSGKICLTVKKPSTHFWNWYAWTALQSDDKDLKKAIAKEYNHNRLIGLKEDPEYHHFCDPAVSDDLLIETKILFSLDNSREGKVNKIVVPLGKGDTLSDLSRIIEINLKDGTNTLGIESTEEVTKRMKMELRAGEILHIKVSGLINAKYFKDGDPDRRFHEFMKENLVLYTSDGVDYYKSPPSHYFIETASKFEIKPEEIWDKIIFENNTDLTRDKVQAYLEIQNDKALCKKLCLTHQVTTEHQMWSWNGKLSTFNKGILDNPADVDNVLDPVNTDTTKAMKFEVDFAERPDFTSNVTRRFFLTANPDGSTRQIIFTHSRPDEKRALYYLLNVQLHSRYELLEGYNDIVKAHSISKGIDPGTRWRRHFRKTRISKKLPRPAIRFIVPLTKSLQTEEKTGNISNAASLLIVLDDVWYTEAGLAEKLQVGIEVVEKDKTGKLFMQAGLDPIISGDGTPELDKNNHHIKETEEQDPLDETKLITTKRFVFDAVGPIGLTFDQNSILPKINASCFIVNIPETSGVFKDADTDFHLKPWSMMKISVRRALEEGLHESFPESDLDQLGSGWTESEWVQHLPDTKTFIPRSWRDDNKDALDFTIRYSLDQKGNIEKNCEISIADEEYLMKIEQEIGENCEKFLILSKRSFDVGGLPTESYVAAVALKGMKKAVLNHDAEDISTAFRKNKEGINGYARILTVRTHSSQNSKLGSHKESLNVWEGLFGASVNGDVALDGIQSDSIYALPLISERVPINLNVTPK